MESFAVLLAIGLGVGLGVGSEGDPTPIVGALVIGELVGDLVGGAMIATVFAPAERELTSVVTFAKVPTFCS